MEDRPNDLAAVLGDELARAGITQAELARRAGVTRAYIGRLLAGQQGAPTGEVVGMIAQALALDGARSLRLYLAVGLVPPALRGILAGPVLVRLLGLLAAAPPGRRSRVERVLVSLLDLMDDA
jgi:transcriptional regulator with XRE-family HTH domain